MDNFSQVTSYYSYDSFLVFTGQLSIEGKTSGLEQTEARVGFTKLNYSRMLRWNKTIKLDDKLVSKLKSIRPQIWWVITEAWCGDSAQNLPAIAAMAKASEGRVDLRIILRDEHLDIMVNYLTNGGLSIPKLIAMGEDNELFTWGPRPSTVQNMMLDWKGDPNGRSHKDFELELHTWYARNKGAELQEEFIQLL